MHRAERSLTGAAFYQHDRVKLSIALVAGLSVAYVAGIIEAGGHPHDEARPAAAASDSSL